MKALRIVSVLTNISTVMMLVFLYLFIERNAPGLTRLFPIIAIAVVYGLLYLVAAGVVLRALESEPAAGAVAWPARSFLLLGSVALLMVFFDATVMDYYQPLSLYDEAIGMLALWWGLLIVQNLVGLFSAGGVARVLALPTFVALLGWPLAASLAWVNSPDPGPKVASNTAVFVGGEGGYAIYRIPGLVLIPAGATLANGSTLEADRLLAFAEARRDGALDSGAIDLVLRVSDDGGVSWSEQQRICRHQLGDNRGKCGNPTPLYDQASGNVVLAYNLSGLEEDARHHSAQVITSPDAGLNWAEPRFVADDNFVFGPGKGIQKTSAPNAGRLLLPGYVNGRAHLYYSDDSGVNWYRDAGLAGGNETDVAELSDGRLYLATRHIAPISRAPEPNGRLFSISSDGGGSWPEATLDEALPTPVCQVSVLQADDDSLLFSNPAHTRARVNMTVRRSADYGASWSSEVQVYPGPAGYSVLARGSDGDIYLLYENGNMAYSERISLARIARDTLLPPKDTSKNSK